MKPERIEQMYNEIVGLVVPLDPNPAARGPGYLQDLISKTRGYLNQVSFFLQEVHRERHRLESEKETKEAAFMISSDELLASDARVTRLPNIDDRKAMINLLLRSERMDIMRLGREVKNLGHVEKALKHRHKELESTMSAIRMQRSLVDMELRTGAFYGDESNESRGSWMRKSPGVRNPMGDDIDGEEIDRLFKESKNGSSEDDDMFSDLRAEMEGLTPSAPSGGTPAPSVAVTPNGLYCEVCGSPQFNTPSGATCENGHGGVNGLDLPPSPPPVKPKPPIPAVVVQKDELDIFLEMAATKSTPPMAAEDDDLVEFLQTSTPNASSEDDGDLSLGELLDGAEYATKKPRKPSTPRQQAEPIPPAALPPPPVVVKPFGSPQEGGGEDLEIKNFLEGDDFDDVFDNL